VEDLTELSWDVADKVEILAGDLHERVQGEIKRLLISQLEKIGFEFQANLPSNAYHNLERIEKLKRKLYPDDPNALCTYEYDGKPILGVKIGPNGMSILFAVPEIKDVETFFANPKWIAKIETQKGEVQDG